jgi:hypothetical protein
MTRRLPEEDRERIRVQVADGVSEAEGPRREGLGGVHGLPDHEGRGQVHPPQVAPREVLEDLLARKQLTAVEIAAVLGIDEAMVRGSLRHYPFCQHGLSWLGPATV